MMLIMCVGGQMQLLLLLWMRIVFSDLAIVKCQFDLSVAF